MSNEHKMREALQAAYEAHQDDFEQPWLSLAAEALAAPASEQVDLTDAEICEVYEQTTFHELDPSRVWIFRAVIAAHEAKRASCSQTAKKSTHEAGRVDETEKSEHVGGAA